MAYICISRKKKYFITMKDCIILLFSHVSCGAVVTEIEKKI
jgi:hypothetical protein